jgi:hypothetical protein
MNRPGPPDWFPAGEGGGGNPKPPRGALANQLRPRMTNTDTAHTAAEEIESIEINALGR